MMKPRTNDKYVGVELEFCSSLSQDYIIERLQAAKIKKFIEVGYDSSIDIWIKAVELYPYQLELRILAKESEIEKIIRKLFLVIKDHVKVNASCGVHVHLDMRNRKPGIAYKKLVDYLPKLNLLVNKGRLRNRYCIQNRSNDFNNMQDYNKYRAINKNAYREHKTLEVRLHHGSKNPDQIISWIKVLTSKVNNRKPPKQCFEFYKEKLVA